MLDFPVHPQQNALSRLEAASETVRTQSENPEPRRSSGVFRGLVLSAPSSERLLMQRRGSRFSAGFTRSALRLTSEQNQATAQRLTCDRWRCFEWASLSHGDECPRNRTNSGQRFILDAPVPTNASLLVAEKTIGED